MAMWIAMSHRGDAVMKEREYSVAEARDKLPSLVHEAERGRPVRITRRGKRAAVLISEAAFRRSHRASGRGDRKSTRLNSSHTVISYAVFCLKKKKETKEQVQSYNDTRA